MDVETLVRLSNPTKTIQAVRITEDNGPEIAARWKNVTHDAERNVILMDGLQDIWLKPGCCWVIEIPDGLGTATFAMSDESLFQSYRRMTTYDVYRTTPAGKDNSDG